MKHGIYLVALGLALGLAGCDGSTTGGSDAGSPPPSTDSGAPPPASDSGTPAMMGTDAGTPTDSGAPMMMGTDASAPAGGGSITGTVTRSAEPAAGGVGHLYIAVFTSDPVTDRAGAMNVAFHRVEDVDMSGAGASVPYTITGIPPRAEPYYVTAFLDDNGTVDATDPSMAGPDRGDLVALEGFASPTVTVSSEATVTLDLDLNFNLPF